MNLDQLPAVIVPALILAGNLWHFVWAVNISSGLGYHERTLERSRIVLLAGLLGSSAFLAWHSFEQPPWTWTGPLRAYAIACLISGGIVGPFGPLISKFRRTPGALARKTSHVDLAEIPGPAAFIGEGLKARLLRLPLNESFHLRRSEWDLEFPGLPRPLRGLSVLHLTDLHFAPCYRREFFEAVIESCREWPADIVLFTGDLVDDDETIAWIEPVLRKLEARLGKFAILGNHDLEHHPNLILHELHRAGFETLEGKWTTLDIDGATLAIGGTSAPWGPTFDHRDIPPADFRLLLSHSPDQFPKAPKWGIDLMLSGHNHGGQVRLPVIGPVFMPSRYSRRFDRGFFRSGPTLMYVSEGVAGKHPVRFGCKPEINRFVFQATGMPARLPHDHEQGIRPGHASRSGIL